MDINEAMAELFDVLKTTFPFKQMLKLLDWMEEKLNTIPLSKR